jgi:hypothetical protein
VSQAILVDASEYQILCLEIGKAKQRGEDALQRIAELERECARLTAELAGIRGLLKYAEDDWIELECGPADKSGNEVTVIRLEPGQGEQRVFRAPTIEEALKIAAITPKFQGEKVQDVRDRITGEVLKARKERDALKIEREGLAGGTGRG